MVCVGPEHPSFERVCLARVTRPVARESSPSSDRPVDGTRHGEDQIGQRPKQTDNVGVLE
jgi:hypothetical protein